MPEFRMRHTPQEDELDDFTRAYVEAMLFADCPLHGEESGCDGSHGVGDLAPEALERAVRDCATFQARYGEAIAGEEERAGADFWFTRTGHGCGFWDGDWPEPVGVALTAACKRFGHVDAYQGDDGLIYLS